ncbi:allophanate hydrolase protein [Rhizobium leguminosarum bv. phaseoli CCGM1]|nr:allophanate hydrolase protein [Rhizobium leguminosarum bv. phaseoli CCGM1]
MIRPFEDDQPGVALLKYEAGGVIITTKLSFRNGLASSATPR